MEGVNVSVGRVNFLELINEERVDLDFLACTDGDDDEVDDEDDEDDEVEGEAVGAGDDEVEVEEDDFDSFASLFGFWDADDDDAGGDLLVEGFLDLPKNVRIWVSVSVTRAWDDDIEDVQEDVVSVRGWARYAAAAVEWVAVLTISLFVKKYDIFTQTHTARAIVILITD